MEIEICLYDEYNTHKSVSKLSGLQDEFGKCIAAYTLPHRVTNSGTRYVQR